MSTDLYFIQYLTITLYYSWYDNNNNNNNNNDNNNNNNNNSNGLLVTFLHCSSTFTNYTISNQISGQLKLYSQLRLFNSVGQNLVMSGLLTFKLSDRLHDRLGLEH